MLKDLFDNEAKNQLKKYCNFYSYWAENEVADKILELLKTPGRKKDDSVFYEEMEGYGVEVRDKYLGKEFRLGYFSDEKLTRGLIFEMSTGFVLIGDGRFKNGELKQGTFTSYNQVGEKNCKDVTDNATF